ncbi:hypothetical protein EHQ57_11780 [Leptospira wolffii]|uniref:hypothetical protein n=1 Tax=Leptospira wolffii TaxID=409998 RepID=UPI001082D033|nr:hypothetical protein [Leptospira wolffii]TGK71128.1 hypothetical protein EHQ35_13375 [Leptospira wolffii]TGL29594.1 hypothetical protein EHQ57_11780 [Leptospira wolffii]
MKILKILLTLLIAGLAIFGFLIYSAFYCNTSQPSIVLPEFSNIDVFAAKDFFFKIGKNLYVSDNKHLNLSNSPIWSGDAKELFVSPDGKYALIYSGERIQLIDQSGKILFVSDEFTDTVLARDEQDKRKFLTPSIQWRYTSDAFYMIGDVPTNVNGGYHNKSEIYKYDIKSASIELLHSFDSLIDEDICVTKDEKYVYYFRFNSKGNSEIRKTNLQNKKDIIVQMPEYGDNIRFFRSKEIFFNYNDYKWIFHNCSYRKSGVVDDVFKKGRVNVYYANSKKKSLLLTGNSSHGGIKGGRSSYFQGGYFLPGDIFFIPRIYQGALSGQLIFNTESSQIMRLEHEVEFYFNINSDDYNDVDYFLGIDTKLNSFEIDKYL